MNYYEKYIKRFYKVIYAYENLIPKVFREDIKLTENYGKTINIMLELRADELISNSVCEFIFKNKSNAEIFKTLVEFENIAGDIGFENEQVNSLITLCLNTVINREIVSITCSQALELITDKNNLLFFQDGFAGVTKDTGKILFEFGMKLYLYNKKDEEERLVVCNENDIDNIDGIIIPSDYIAALYIGQIKDNEYLHDFTEYSKNNNITADRHIITSFNDYLRRIKQTFRFNLYVPYRHIADKDIYNIIDFRLSEKYSSEITVNDEHHNKTSDELRNEAVSIYMNGNNINNHNVLEIFNNNKISHYVYRSDIEPQLREIYDFKKLYPNADILVAAEKDFKKENRLSFAGKIATNDFDTVILGHSSFDKIRLSPELEEQYIYEELEEHRAALEEIKYEGRADKRSFSVKQIEQAIKSLEVKLKDLQSRVKDDNVICFEKLGFDYLAADEFHNYKNCFIATKMSNVAGVQTTAAQKSEDMLMKTQYLNEKYGYNNILTATGTPVKTP